MATRTVTTTHKWYIDNIRSKMSDAANNELFVSDVFSLDGKSGAKFLTSFGRGNAAHRDLYLVCTGLGRNQEMQLTVNGWVGKSNSKTGGYTGAKKLMFNKAGIIGLVESYLTSSFVTSFNKFGDSVYAEFVCIKIQHEVPVDESNFDGGVNELTDRSEFCQNMLDLHLNGLFDVTIQVEDKEFKANKVNLMAYSEVFKLMLSCSNSTEAKTGVIKMEKSKPEVIDALIRWIYHAKIDNLTEIAINLYRTADKYKIDLLKQ